MRGRKNAAGQPEPTNSGPPARASPCRGTRRPADRRRPSTAKTPASSGAGLATGSCALRFAGDGRNFHLDHRLLFDALLGDFDAVVAEFHEVPRLVEQALALVRVPQGFAHDAPRDTRTE